MAYGSSCLSFVQRILTISLKIICRSSMSRANFFLSLLFSHISSTLITHACVYNMQMREIINGFTVIIE